MGVRLREAEERPAGEAAPADHAGDRWTWTALDADSKLIVSWHVGPRDAGSAYMFIAVFGHGDGLAESIERVHRVLAAGTPDRVRPHIAVQAGLSTEPNADTPGTLYLTGLLGIGGYRRYRRR